MSAVEWRAIPGWEGAYQVSNDGRVRSLDRIVVNRLGQARRVSGRVRRPGTMRKGYLIFALSLHGVTTYRTAHSLVMLAFVGPRPEGMVICHFDGDKHNNALENLRYDTPSENERDKARQGVVHPNARKTHCKSGHPFDEANTNIRGQRRECRACKDNWSRNRRRQAVAA